MRAVVSRRGWIRRALGTCAVVGSLGPMPAWAEGAKPVVVSTINIIADMAAQVAGDTIEAVSIVPLGGDPHTFEPTPAVARQLSGAQLILRNGMGLERWLDRMLGTSSAARPIVTVTDGLTAHLEHDAHGNVNADPHLWMDPVLAQTYVQRITEALGARFPQHAALYRQRGAAYKKQLELLDREVAARLAVIPPERRKLVATHDAFRYFSQRYDLTMVGSLWGISTETEPSASSLAKIVRAIRAERVPAAFIETTINPKLMQRIAKETGIRIGDPLYGDSLGVPGSGADTYIGMVRSNVRAMVGALSGAPSATEP